MFLLVRWQRPRCEMYPDAEMQTIWTLGWLALPSMNVTPLAHSHGVSEQCGALTGWEWSELTRVPVAFDGWAYTQGRAHRPCLGHSQCPQPHIEPTGMHITQACTHTCKCAHVKGGLRCRRLEGQERIVVHSHHGGRAAFLRKVPGAQREAKPKAVADSHNSRVGVSDQVEVFPMHFPFNPHSHLVK